LLSLLPFTISVEVSDYELYDLIDTMTSLTPHRTFYEFLGVTPETDLALASTNYRRLSLEWHPDKNKSPNAQKMSSLLGSVYKVLKSEPHRARYNWILNDAPAWHRSGYYMKKIMTAKLSLLQVLGICLGFASLVQFVAGWVNYIISFFRVRDAKSKMRQYSDKELKKMKSKLEEGSSPLLLQSEMFQTMMTAETQISMPSIFSLAIFQSPRAIFWILKSAFTSPKKILTSLFARKTEKKIANNNDDVVDVKKKRYKIRESSPLTKKHEDGMQEEEENQRWTSNDDSELVQAMLLIPEGTTGRWEKIARKLNRSLSSTLLRYQSLKSS